jgi:hypothetical protein
MEGEMFRAVWDRVGLIRRCMYRERVGTTQVRVKVDTWQACGTERKRKRKRGKA